MDAQRFRQFAETQYQFGRWLRHQRDRARRHPHVRTAQVALTIIAQVFFALRSLLRADQWWRTPRARAWLGVAAGAPRGSDTTLLRVLGAWERGRLRQASYQPPATTPGRHGRAVRPYVLAILQDVVAA